MLSIVIAAYNEEKRIGRSLHAIDCFLQGAAIDAEIIVVDDGSTDDTAGVVEGLAAATTGLCLIRYDKNRGKGYALRRGVLASTGEHVLVSDADLSTPIEEVNRLFPYLADCSIAIGSRALDASEIVVRQPLWRQEMGKMFNRIVKLLVLDEFQDTQCGFKLFTGQVARELFSEARIDRFAYDVEILALARKKRLRIAEVPIKWANDNASKVDPVRDSLKMIVDLIRIRLSIGAVKELSAPLPAAPAPQAAASIMPVVEAPSAQRDN